MQKQRSAEKKQVLVTFVTKDANPRHHLPDGAPPMVRDDPASGPWPTALPPGSAPEWRHAKSSLSSRLPAAGPAAGPGAGRVGMPWASAPPTLV
jgi:hypothetical protein